MLKRVQTDVVLGDSEMQDWFLTWWYALAPEVKASYRSTAELTPSREYVAAVPMRGLYDQQEKEMSYEDYFACCAEIYGSDNIQLAKRFQDGLHQTYGDLLRYPGAFFILGTGENTISSMMLGKLFEEFDPESSAKLRPDPGFQRYRYADGDGIVPYFSASMAGRIDALSADRRRACATPSAWPRPAPPGSRARPRNRRGGAGATRVSRMMLALAGAFLMEGKGVASGRGSQSHQGLH